MSRLGEVEYYLCDTSVNPKLFQNKKVKRILRLLNRETKTDLENIIKSSNTISEN